MGIVSSRISPHNDVMKKKRERKMTLLRLSLIPGENGNNENRVVERTHESLFKERKRTETERKTCKK